LLFESTVEAFMAEVVLAREADRAVEGQLADEADEIVVGLSHIFQHMDLGRYFHDTALPPH
jgi:hypothetical protein